MSIATPAPHSSSAPPSYTNHSHASPIKFSLHIQPSPKIGMDEMKIYFTTVLLIFLCLAEIQTSNKRKSVRTPFRDSIKPPILKRLQQLGSPYCFTDSSTHKQHYKPGERGESIESIGSGTIVSGRSPFINRYITPQDNQAKVTSTVIVSAFSIS